MINQTKVHLEGLSDGGITASCHIRKLVGNKREEFQNLKYSLGNLFLEQYYPTCNSELLQLSPKFWAWWSYVWYTNNYRLAFANDLDNELFINVHTHITNPGVFKSFEAQLAAFEIDGQNSMRERGLI